MGFVAAVTALVIAGLWILVHVDLVPFTKWRVLIARVALVPLLGSMYFVPSAYQAGMDWLIERQQTEMLDRIQPMLDDLVPPSTNETSAAP